MRFWFLYCLSAISSIPDAAYADDSIARQQYESGLAAYHRGDYNRAIEKWQSAYAISKRPRFQYIIAEAYERLGEITKAIDALERFLEIADPYDLSKSDAVALLGSLRNRLSATGIVIRGAPDGASITIDGQKWGFTPRPDKIPVKHGSHTVVIEKHGFKRFRSTVIVAAGKVAEVAADLEAETQSSQAERSENLETDRKKRYASNSDNNDSVDGGSGATLLYIISGALAAGTIGSAIWLIDRVDAEDQCGDSETESKCHNPDAIATEKTVAMITTAALGTATLAVLIAAILTGASESDEPSKTAYCSPLSLSGATCTVRF